MPATTTLLGLQQKWPFWQGCQLSFNSDEWPFFIIIAFSLLCCPQSQWHVSHLADILINICFFQSKTQQSSLLGFPGILMLSPWIFAVCSCRNKTNIKLTSPIRVRWEVLESFHPSPSMLLTHSSAGVRAHKRLALASSSDVFLM